MRCLRLVGSLQIWVSFAKEPYKSDLYSSKETYIYKEPTNDSHAIASHTATHCNTLQHTATHCNNRSSHLILGSGTTGTWWRRCISCLRLSIFFRKRDIHYIALLRKMIYKDKASYTSSPLCTAATNQNRIW